ncbi:unnamed protein product [Durusdinium trenchii]|uniref:Pentatricopeptide repeat-containing protein n=1 Tax=Durusdinium trenchii TaxID=1381693 RepID=A0ABP0NPL9_9DINO
MAASDLGRLAEALYDTAFIQELLVLVTFALSYTLWRRVRRSSWPATRSKADAEPAKASRPNLHRAKPKVRDFTDAEKEQAKASEAEMKELLVQNEFTRALNLYRRTERWNLEAFFTEELFGCFVQSGIRVNKVDVVERMLRSLKRARKEAPSKEFWQQTLKLMSSRKHFSLCLLAYSIFEHDMPVDKVIFSCLINAALELNAESRLEALLEKYSQASLSPKDHILHFRCYVQLNSADAAEQLFHRLGDEVSNLMLNMLLLTCVNQKQPERAYQLLQDAKVRETSAKDKLVDIVSYNTVMKGFGAAQMRSRCLDAVRDLIEHGLQPDDITLGALMEACVAESDHALAQQIGDVLISSGREVKPPMCNLFIRGLVKAGGIWKALALYEAMKKQQVRFPDIVLFSVLIKALVGQNALAKALELVEELQKAWRDKQRRKKQNRGKKRKKEVVRRTSALRHRSGLRFPTESQVMLGEFEGRERGLGMLQTSSWGASIQAVGCASTPSVLVLARLASRTRSEGSGRGKLLANCVQMASASESGASPEQLRELKALKAKCR